MTVLPPGERGRETDPFTSSFRGLAGEALTSDIPTEIRREDTMRMGFRAPIQPIYMVWIHSRDRKWGKENLSTPVLFQAS